MTYRQTGDLSSAPVRRQTRRVLVALDSVEDCAVLRQILPAGDWMLRFAPTLQRARAELQSWSIEVVICANRLAEGCWKDVLEEVRRLPAPPQFIVADRLADVALWAEVLNFGGYDLLTTPFDPEETLRVVSMAWDCRKRQQERAASEAKHAGRERAKVRVASGD
jgi:DNA-binding NtrC family response regulator